MANVVGVLLWAGAQFLVPQPVSLAVALAASNIGAMMPLVAPPCKGAGTCTAERMAGSSKGNNDAGVVVEIQSTDGSAHENTETDVEVSRPKSLDNGRAARFSDPSHETLMADYVEYLTSTQYVAIAEPAAAPESGVETLPVETQPMAEGQSTASTGSNTPIGSDTRTDHAAQSKSDFPHEFDANSTSFTQDVRASESEDFTGIQPVVNPQPTIQGPGVPQPDPHNAPDDTLSTQASAINSDRTLLYQFKKFFQGSYITAKHLSASTNTKHTARTRQEVRSDFCQAFGIMWKGITSALPSSPTKMHVSSSTEAAHTAASTLDNATESAHANISNNSVHVLGDDRFFEAHKWLGMRKESARNHTRSKFTDGFRMFNGRSAVDFVRLVRVIGYLVILLAVFLARRQVLTWICAEGALIQQVIESWSVEVLAWVRSKWESIVVLFWFPEPIEDVDAVLLEHTPVVTDAILDDAYSSIVAEEDLRAVEDSQDPMEILEATVAAKAQTSTRRYKDVLSTINDHYQQATIIHAPLQPPSHEHIPPTRSEDATSQPPAALQDMNAASIEEPDSPSKPVKGVTDLDRITHDTKAIDQHPASTSTTTPQEGPQGLIEEPLPVPVDPSEDKEASQDLSSEPSVDPVSSPYGDSAMSIGPSDQMESRQEDGLSRARLRNMRLQRFQPHHPMQEWGPENPSSIDGNITEPGQIPVPMPTQDVVDNVSIGFGETKLDATTAQVVSHQNDAPSAQLSNGLHDEPDYSQGLWGPTPIIHDEDAVTVDSLYEQFLADEPDSDENASPASDDCNQDSLSADSNPNPETIRDVAADNSGYFAPEHAASVVSPGDPSSVQYHRGFSAQPQSPDEEMRDAPVNPPKIPQLQETSPNPLSVSEDKTTPDDSGKGYAYDQLSSTSGVAAPYDYTGDGADAQPLSPQDIDMDDADDELAGNNQASSVAAGDRMELDSELQTRPTGDEDASFVFATEPGAAVKDVADGQAKLPTMPSSDLISDTNLGHPVTASALSPNLADDLKAPTSTEVGHEDDQDSAQPQTLANDYIYAPGLVENEPADGMVNTEVDLSHATNSSQDVSGTNISYKDTGAINSRAKGRITNEYDDDDSSSSPLSDEMSEVELNDMGAQLRLSDPTTSTKIVSGASLGSVLTSNKADSSENSKREKTATDNFDPNTLKAPQQGGIEDLATVEPVTHYEATGQQSPRKVATPKTRRRVGSMIPPPNAPGKSASREQSLKPSIPALNRVPLVPISQTSKNISDNDRAAPRNPDRKTFESTSKILSEIRGGKVDFSSGSANSRSKIPTPTEVQGFGQFPSYESNKPTTSGVSNSAPSEPQIPRYRPHQVISGPPPLSSLHYGPPRYTISQSTPPQYTPTQHVHAPYAPSQNAPEHLQRPDYGPHPVENPKEMLEPTTGTTRRPHFDRGKLKFVDENNFEHDVILEDGDTIFHTEEGQKLIPDFENYGDAIDAVTGLAYHGKN